MTAHKTPHTPSRRTANDRSAVALEVIFQANDAPPRVGMVEDLSAGGARIDATKPCREGEVILVHLPWPSRDEPTTATAVVRWASAHRMGIQFSLTGAADTDAIARLRTAAPAAAKRRELAAANEEQPFSRDALLANPRAVHKMERRVRFQEVD